MKTSIHMEAVPNLFEGIPCRCRSRTASKVLLLVLTSVLPCIDESHLDLVGCQDDVHAYGISRNTFFHYRQGCRNHAIEHYAF